MGAIGLYTMTQFRRLMQVIIMENFVPQLEPFPDSLPKCLEALALHKGDGGNSDAQSFDGKGNLVEEFDMTQS